ncbi:MAG: methyltransferase domain-containing protein [Rhizobiales bacterium]|nr:methyltransferase domain-containing protein [Hyphomicrobiales bacterium]
MTRETHIIFDRLLYVKRLQRARLTGPDILTRSIAAELAERLGVITRGFNTICIIAPDPQPIADAVNSMEKARAVEARDVSPDDDLKLEPGSFDAIFNILDLHAVNDVPGQLSQMQRALVPDGLFLSCLFAGDTLGELRQSWLAAEVQLTGGASPRVAPMIGVRELGSLLQRAGFALPVADLDRTIVRYPDAISLIHEVRSLGMSNNLMGRSRSAVSRRLLGAAAAYYQDHFADADGRVRATLEVAWLTGWSPHGSQQQPLKPGSATMRLADALKVSETKLTADRSSAE